MDNFELKPERKKINRKSLVWNILTVLVLLGICLLAYYFLTIFKNPNSPLNPFLPATTVPTLTLYQTETLTPTIIPLEATWTSTATIQPLPSRTKAPTWTFLPQMITPSITPTPTSMSTEPTPTITTTPMPVSAKITYMASTDFHPDKKCDWFGVAGKVLGTDGTPLLYQEIQMGGTLDGKAINFLISSGLAPAYGQSGFELILSDHPIASTQTLWIQLLDTTAKPLTNKIYFDTYTDCTQNMVWVVFTKNR
jgi:hypothetical protein